jgi:hypothetical protein
MPERAFSGLREHSELAAADFDGRLLELNQELSTHQEVVKTSSLDYSKLPTISVIGYLSKLRKANTEELLYLGEGAAGSEGDISSFG